MFFLAALTFLLLRDHTGLYRISLLCCLLHEGGHLAVYILRLKKVPRLHCSLWGICLEWNEMELGPQERFWVAASGPLTNLTLFAVFWLWMQYSASYWGWYFAGSNLLTAGYNLLPILPLDGGQMIAAWRDGKTRKKENCNSSANTVQ